MKKLTLLVAIALLASVSFTGASVQADIFDNFDSYAPGDLNGQGPWVDFGGALLTSVSTDQAFSGTQSSAYSQTAAGAYGSDSYIINTNNGVLETSGLWELSMQTYIDSAFDGGLAIYQSMGVMPTTFAQGGFVVLNNATGAIEMQNGSGDSAALLLDTWAEVAMLIDLDNDTFSVSYNGTVFHTGAWDTDAGATALGLGGLNIWAAGGGTQSGTAYVDDVSLTAVPEPGSLSVLALGLVGSVLIRRRRNRK